jgi:hypothetical protein
MTTTPAEVADHLAWFLGDLLGDPPRQPHVWWYPKIGCTRAAGWDRVRSDVSDTRGAGIRKAHTKNYWVWYMP